MKTLLLSIFLLIGAWAVKAQPLETQKRQVPVVVPLEKAPELSAPTKSNTQPFSIGAKLPPYQPSFANPSEKSIDFTGKSNLVHRKIELSPRTNNFGNQKEDYKAVKGDQFFGDFTNNGDFVNVYCRDFAAIDGDRISIFVNGVELPTLKNYFKILNVEYLKSIFKYDEYSDIHGDLTIENIIGILDNYINTSINKKYREYYFIDPNTGNIHDSPFLDYAKLLQSLHGNYEFLMNISTIQTGSNTNSEPFRNLSVIVILFKTMASNGLKLILSKVIFPSILLSKDFSILSAMCVCTPGN